MKFLGYVRSDGSVGIRNHVLILPPGLVSAKICECVRGTRTITTADNGSSRTKRDRETVARTLTGLGRNPNIAAVVIHEANWGLWYPETQPEVLAQEIAKCGKPVELIKATYDGEVWEVIGKGIRCAQQMVYNASRLRREKVDASNLSIGIKCGGSDATSGIAGNPVVGNMVDRVVRAGGIALFGETTEIIGAEHILAKRAVNDKVGRKIITAANENNALIKSTGVDFRTVNPMPQNIAGGITTLEEKALGAISKAGSSSIQGVLKYAERPPAHGLYFADTWPPTQSMLVGIAAAGANIVVFQLGGQGAHPSLFITPSISSIMPILWATANSDVYMRKKDSVDFYSGGVIEGKESIEEAGGRLFKHVLDIASGAMTKSETWNYSDAVQMLLKDPLV